ncbi:hypothetical protein TNCV_2721061 [Trichonephila clavipes]|nr:hypothetical protein TNCV_2721061 [Trichonephila clavipes]
MRVYRRMSALVASSLAQESAIETINNLVFLGIAYKSKKNSTSKESALKYQHNVSNALGKDKGDPIFRDPTPGGRFFSVCVNLKRDKKQERSAHRSRNKKRQKAGEAQQSGEEKQRPKGSIGVD